MNYRLPEYPCKEDVWDMLAKETRPIVVYGMGNGADKLIDRFEKYGIKISDFFASDGFVRGHSFHGFRVKSFSEIKETYPEFVIVLSFASNREDVLSMLEVINSNHELIIPDMPVAGVDEYFDRDFYNKNYEKILEAYERLSDEKSKQTYASVINYKLTGQMKHLLAAVSDKDEMYSLLPCDKIQTTVDAGAYNGDTVKEIKGFFAKLKKVFALEPDKRNFKKLAKYCEAENKIEVQRMNSAAWSCDGVGDFSDSGNRNSSVSSTASFEHRETTVSLVKIDSLTDEKIDYIKYDVEGAEAEALLGSDKIILRDRPSLLVSLYHRSRDIFELVNILGEKYPFYKMYLRRLKCVPAWEINLILVNKE